METVTRFAERQAGSVSVASTPGPEVARTLSVTASYLLSEDGRKASLLAGGDGRARPADRAAGSGQPPAPRVRGQTRCRATEAQTAIRDGRRRGIVRIDAAPVYDAPPTIDELYRAAAKNHELESAYYAERVAQRIEAAATTDARACESVAEAFLGGQGQRAVAHPPPSPKTLLRHHRARSRAVRRRRPTRGSRKRCAARGAPALPRGPARQGRTQSAGPSRAARPPRGEEALHRRVDRSATEPRNRRRDRQPACCRWTKRSSASLTRCSPPIGDRARLHARRRGAAPDVPPRQSTGSADVVVAQADVAVRSAHAVKATAAQWAAVQEIQSALPDANVVLREHRAVVEASPGVPSR